MESKRNLMVIWAVLSIAGCADAPESYASGGGDTKNDTETEVSTSNEENPPVVTQDDLAGAWRRISDGATETLTFEGDGSYAMRITRDGDDVVEAGTWSIEGSQLSLETPLGEGEHRGTILTVAIVENSLYSDVLVRIRGDAESLDGTWQSTTGDSFVEESSEDITNTRLTLIVSGESCDIELQEWGSSETGEYDDLREGTGPIEEAQSIVSWTPPETITDRIGGPPGEGARVLGARIHENVIVARVEGLQEASETGFRRLEDNEIDTDTKINTDSETNIGGDEVCCECTCYVIADTTTGGEDIMVARISGDGIDCHTGCLSYCESEDQEIRYHEEVDCR